MRIVYNKIVHSLLVIVSLTMLTISCTKDNNKPIPEGEGCLLMTLSLSSGDATTKSGTEEYAKILENSTLKIYTEEGKLIRRYEPATEIEESIYLISGSYKAVLTAGFDTPATFDKEARKFYGEKEFIIEANKTSEITVNCKMVNTLVAVDFDETIAKIFDVSSIAYVSLSNTFSKDDAVNNTVPTLVYTKNNVGYFLMPDETSNISWGFYAESSNAEIGKTYKEGVISLPQSATQYTLNFKYSNTPDGFMELYVSVDDQIIESDDLMSFSPQPSITASNFDPIIVTNYVDQTLTYEIKALKDITKVEITATDKCSNNTFTVVPFDNSNILETKSTSEGANITIQDSKNLTLSLSSELFNKFNSGGVQAVTINVTDDSKSIGTTTTKFNVSGIMSLDNMDYWGNTGVVKANVTNKNAANVIISYRKVGATDWIDLPTVKEDGNTYSANIAANWKEGKNSNGLTVYSLESGITANSKFETKLTVESCEYPSLQFSTDGGQTIPFGDMESGDLTCWGNSNSGSTSWGSGNNSMASGLCNHDTRLGMGGNKCAYLKGRSVSVVQLAAGNLFLGTFSKGSFDGTVSFGQSYNWTSRPNTFKLKYSASLGTVDANKHKTVIAKGKTDNSRIFFAIVDWSGRHGVKSGTGSPSGVWAPNEVNETSEGKIIGYAFIDIKESTPEAMQTLELPIYYYDNVTKPSKNITIVISCATSAYGDYMNGSTSSKLWVDDFEFGY